MSSASAGWGVSLRESCKYLIGTPTQYSACAIIVNYWIPSTKVSNGVWVAIFIVVTGAMQFMPVRVFGEYEVRQAPLFLPDG